MFVNSSTPPVGANQTGNRTTRNKGVNLPDFMFTTTAPEKSEDEFKAAIQALARRDAAAGKFHNRDAEFQNLERSFISVVSPDRQGMINSSLTAIQQGKQMAAQQGWHITQNLVNSLLSGRPIGHTPPHSRTGQEQLLFELRDGNGQHLARLTSGGWRMVLTDAEVSRRQEFSKIYNAAWDAARAEMNACPVASAKHNAATIIDLKANGIQVDIADKMAQGMRVDLNKLAQHGIDIRA